MLYNVGIIVSKGYQDRAEKINQCICEITGENKNYLIDFVNPRFSNGESKVVIKESVRNKNIFILADVGNYSCSYSLYGNENHMSPDDHFMDIVRIISAMCGKARNITVIMPLLYASRQHRRKGRESLDCAMALRYIESLGVNNVITFDVHDPEIQNTIPYGSLDSLFPIYSILSAFIPDKKDEISKDKMIVISPDSGAMERSRRYASLLNLELGLFYKRRDYTNVVDGKNPILQHEYIGPDVKNKNILIVDDMLSSGESVIDIANNLKARGCAKVYIVTTFGFFTAGTALFDKLHSEGVIEKIYSTNASYLNPELKSKKWFKEVDISPILAELIVALGNDSSISKLMDPADKLKELLNTLK